MHTIKLLLGFICLSTMAFLVFAQGSKKPLSNQWSEDIDYLQKTLEERHINLYHKTNKQEFTDELNKIKKRLPELSQAEIMVELMRAVKKIGDGHTQFNYWGNTHHKFPVEFYLVNEIPRLTAVEKSHQHLLGMQLQSINGVAISEIIYKLKPVLAGVENQYSEYQRLAETLPVAEVLEGTGIISNTQSVEFVFMDEQQKPHKIKLNKALSSHSVFGNLIRLQTQLPKGFSKQSNSLDNFYLYLDKKRQTALINFIKYPGYDEIQNFAEDLQSVFNDHNIRHVIIDFRENGGGDFFVGLALAWGLIIIDGIDWKNGTYVLIGRKTFSASMSNAAQYRQIVNSTLVGEPTGANPVGYQDADTFSLPNSGWKVMYSKRLYKFQDPSTQGVQPDILLPLDWDEFKRGKDNQLEWILKDIEKRKNN